MSGSLFSLFLYVPIIVVLVIALIAVVMTRLMDELSSADDEQMFATTALFIISAILSYGAVIGTLVAWWLGWLG